VGRNHVITSCTCDCPDTCSILACVENGRVAHLRGNPGFKPTAGFLCRKARGFLARLYSPDRILRPMRREGSRWREVSWEDAMSLLAAKMEAAYGTHGPLSVLYFRDSGSIAALKHINDRLFNLLGGATFMSGTLCGGAGIAGQTCDFGYRTAHDPEDLLNSRVIIIWGRNPAVTNIHLMPLLKRARKAGSRIVLIDPVATETSRLVDTHLQIAPGTDALLAIGLTMVLLEEGCGEADFIKSRTNGFTRYLKATHTVDLALVARETGLAENEIRDLAMHCCRERPVAVIGGWGLQRRRDGALAYRYIDAFAAVAGSIGVRGGGVSHGMDEMRWFDLGAALNDEPARRRFLPRPQAGRAILSAVDPRIEVAVVTGANPVNQCPNTDLVRRAFDEIPFVAVCDMFMTDTAAVADLFLPATHFLQERDILGSYWHNYVMPVNPAQPRLGEEKTDLEIMHLLARKLGVAGRLPGEPDYYLKQIVSPLAADGVNLEGLMRGPYRPQAAVDVPFADGRFMTPSAKFEFVDSLPARPAGSAEYPYWLLSPHPAGSIHSQLADVSQEGPPEAHVSAATARACGLGPGDEVEVRTAAGALTCRAAVGGRVRDDTVLIYEGWWDRLGGSVNRLTPDTLSDGGNSATYYDARCSLRRVGPAAGHKG
jgi:anaerobic selenocysteine-containing dehydrogenase